MNMNLLLGTLMLFSAILLTFFGVPIVGLYVMTLFGPPNLTAVDSTLPLEPIETTSTVNPKPFSIPITLKKICHKGHYIWVDA